MASLSHSPFNCSLHSQPRTLVGIWSSCSAAACNTPYSARFSPRCIAHWARSARIPRKRGQLLGWSLYRTQKAPCRGRWQTEGLTEGLTQTTEASMQPLRLLVALAATTLVGIWSSCFATACNTPYSARFSPRCIAHRARSARIPRKRGQLWVSGSTSARRVTQNLSSHLVSHKKRR